MALTESWSLASVSVSSELSVISGTTSLQANTTAGLYSFWADPVGAAMAKADYYALRIYEKVLSGGTKREAFKGTLAQAQDEQFVMPPLMLLNGFDFTIEKTAGTNRSWRASVRKAGTITQAYSMSAVTVGGTELSVVSGTTSLQTITNEPGAFQLFLDCANMLKADEYEIRVYEKVENGGGTKRVCYVARIQDVQAQLFVTPILLLYGGWDFTVKKIGGTDRAFDGSIRKAA